jgi:hypothetical protein
MTDYRAGEILRPSKEHIESWVEQFDENVRDRILTEMVHVLGQTYITKAKVEGFLSGLVMNEKITGGDAKSFWQGAKLLNIQKKGSSQREMLSCSLAPSRLCSAWRSPIVERPPLATSISTMGFSRETASLAI